VEDLLNGVDPPAAQAAATRVVGAPAPLTPLVGRLDEAAEIGSLLARHRLITVTGPAGGGKTRLALAAAQQWAIAHPEAEVAWVALAATDEPELVAEQFAATVGTGDKAAEHWPAGIRGSDALVVLDNCEHLIDAVVDLIDGLLGTGSNLRVLVTSRTPLGLSGERRWPLPPLRTPEADEQVGLLEYDAVRMFVDPARAVRPDFDVESDSDDAARVAAICRRLDGNPLAIELCAARIQVLGLSELGDALEDAGRLLAGGTRAGPQRHRSLWDALDWSYRC
jgi:predicted ATPase